jgi:hypothetical protein
MGSVTVSAVPDEHSPEVGRPENTGNNLVGSILTAGPIPSFLLADPGRSVCSAAGAELMDVIVRCPVEDSGDRTLAGKARGVRHRPTVSGGAIGQVGQVSVRPVAAVGCAELMDAPVVSS